MEKLLDNQTRQEIIKFLSEMKSNVKIHVITDLTSKNCGFCKEIKQLFMELDELGINNLEIMFYDKWNEEFSKYGLSYKDIPAIIIESPNVKGKLVFRGIPSGHEFGMFIETLLEISLGHIHIPEHDLNKIGNINKPINIYVYVTPTCPYCPAAVAVAYSIAMVNPNISAYAIEASEFEEESRVNNIKAVPTVIIKSGDKNIRFEGALPMDLFIKKLESVL